MKGPTKNRTSSPTGWLRMRVWRMSLRRMKCTTISRHGSFLDDAYRILLLSHKVIKMDLSVKIHHLPIKITITLEYQGEMTQ